MKQEKKFYNKIYIYNGRKQKEPNYIIYQETTNPQPYTIKRYRTNHHGSIRTKNTTFKLKNYPDPK